MESCKVLNFFGGSVVSKSTVSEKQGAVAAVPVALTVVQNCSMQRQSTYPYTETESPGAVIHHLRNEAGLSQRGLADRCNPPLDHTTIRRIEHNEGYTKDSLERIAVALSVTVADLFLPSALAQYPSLPAEARERIQETIEDAALAAKARAAG
ncbi:MAG: helix-turn-helix domain-containing protein [Candidatus Sedimenticola sp. (ex Thyasira tokunagai)]